jgi:CAAX protease family protein
MSKNKVLRLFLLIFLLLIFYQIFRIVIIEIIFLAIGFSFFNEKIATAIATIILIFLSIVFSKKENISLSFKPDFRKNSKTFFILVTAFVIVFFVITPLVTNSVDIKSIFLLIESALLIPIFEEALFRGYLWNKLEFEGFSKITVFIITTLLFGFWHLGYIDVIMLRVSFDNLFFIMAMKVITGIIIGAIIGFARYKTENIYLGLLIHIFINTFG